VVIRLHWPRKEEPRFAQNTNGADRRLFGFCPGQGRRRKPMVCPTLWLSFFVAQAFLPVWLYAQPSDYDRGVALFQKGDHAAAVPYLRRAAEAHPQDAQAWKALGKASEAEREFRGVMVLARNADAQPGVALGLFLVRQGRFEEAIAQFDEVLKRFPSSSDAHLHLGRALLELGRLESAIPHLERAVALDAGSPQAHLLLAKAYVRSGRPAEAQPHFDVAAKSAQ